MNRLLPLPELAKKIAYQKRKHRRVIERWLDSEVGQPTCGCILHWEWIWGTDDWIFPLDVAVASLAVKSCDKHALNFYDMIDFQEQIFNVLHRLRSESNNSIDDLEMLE